MTDNRKMQEKHLEAMRRTVEDTNMVMEHSGEISFENMLVLRCKYCGRGLTWHTFVSGPNQISYVSSCCGVSYRASICTVTMDIEDTGIVMTNVCKCGHDKAEHDKDKGCTYRMITHFTSNDVCGCWRFRAARKQGEKVK